MFRCRVCEEKEKRILELKEQLQYFRSVLNPPPKINKYELEETVVMNGGSQEEIDPAALEAEELENERIRRETDFIFSGNTEPLEV